MTDHDIRAVLKRELRAQYQGDVDTMIIEELGLRHGKTRVDVAVVNGYLHGFELKSDSDTLRRLESQARIYSDVLDRATLVVAPHHLDRAVQLVPCWWGISVADSDTGHIRLVQVRVASENPAPNALDVAKLLWRDEAVTILRELGGAKGVLSRPRRMIYARLAEIMPLDVLRARVRCQLRCRQDWRSVQRHMSDGD